MVIGAIADLHGSDMWKHFVSNHTEVQKWVFMGDYVDSFDIPVEDQISNLQDIIMYKKENPEDVELLLGNHCVQYLYYPKYRCGGFNSEKYGILQQIFFTERDLFKIAYQPNKYWLFTHAGVTIKWYRKYLDKLIKYAKDLGLNLIEQLEQVLN